MRLLLIIIFLLSFQTFSTADDIRDFEIEGISVGDSLLKYYNLDQINNFLQYDYKNKKFYKLQIMDQSLKYKLEKYLSALRSKK